jgi:hypothetical protein
MKETRATRLQQVNKQTMELRKAKISQTKDTTMTEDISYPKGTSQQ